VRIDTEGRDVTNLPGLWSEEDRIAGGKWRGYAPLEAMARKSYIYASPPCLRGRGTIALEQQFRFRAFQERIRDMDAKQLRRLALILFAQQISTEATIDRVMSRIDALEVE